MKDETFIRIAARYWADFLRTNAGPEALRDTGMAHEGLDGFRRGVMLNSMVELIRRKLPAATPEQVDAFEKALVQKLLTDRYCQAPSVDYHPNYTLMEAITAAGIDAKNVDLRFPWKTSMAIDSDGVHVHEGNAGYRSLVMTKRKALCDALREALSKSDLNPYKEERDWETNPATDAERDLYTQCCDRISLLRSEMDPMPPGPFKDLLAKYLPFVFNGETAA